MIASLSAAAACSVIALAGSEYSSAKAETVRRAAELSTTTVGEGTHTPTASPTETKITSVSSPMTSAKPTASPTTTATATATAKPNATTKPPSQPTPKPTSTPTSTPTDDAAAANAAAATAVAYARSRGERAAVEVYDRSTGQSFGAGDTAAQFQSASVVKVFIVANLFWTGQMADPSIAARAYEMITASDDDAANYLYGLVGYDDLSAIVAQRLGLTGLAPPPVSGSWGSTYITADAMIRFYLYAFADKTIGPWLSNAMAHTSETAADGTDQYFGIPSATTSWAVKQGWVCCEEGVAGVNSSGLVQDSRFIVVILTQGAPSLYLDYLTQTITTMAQQLLPGGRFPV